jgi:squalene-associated FAD-dependent desaturase
VKPVVIAGGGLSGLAAGVFLSRRGIPIVLCEQKPYAGGRAYSFRDPRSGETVDNGQHVLIAGYDATMRLLDVLGSRHLVRVQSTPRFLLHHPERGFCPVVLPHLPPPFHLIAGILRSNLLRMADRMRLLRAGIAAASADRSMERSLGAFTVQEWLHRTGQNEETTRSFWEPLAIAMMNEQCATASALVFVRSLRKAFFDHWRSAAFAVPQAGLSTLFADPAIDCMIKRGGKVLLGTGVARVLEAGGAATGVRLEDGSVIESSAVILAVPSHRVRDLLPDALGSQGFLAGIEQIPFSPILSLHLWFPHDFMRHEDIVGIIGRRLQWIFNRRSIVPPSRGNSPNVAEGYVCGVISAAQKYVGLTNDQLLAIALEDLRALYGQIVSDPSSTLILREKRATFSSSPATEVLRPGARTPLPNLFLAGDWTATGYPATIEGAVVSAERCAALV